MSATLGDLSALSQLQLQSVLSEAAVDGTLSPFSRSDVVLLLEVVEPWVDVRFSGALPDRGGEFRDIDRRKSK